MGFPSRIEWLEGRYANVDGIPFRMPISTKASPAMFAAFPCDGDAAEALIPGDELHAWRFRGKGVVVIAVVNYQDTTIGKYVEFCLGVMATSGRRPCGAIRSALFRGRYGTGVYIYDLPVSSEISVKGGLGIWGMPKRQANLDFVVSDDTVSSQYDLDGELVARIDIPRPTFTKFPMRMTGTGWGADFRGLMTKSTVYSRGTLGFHIRPCSARLVLGDHPRARPLKALDIGERALISGYIPRFNGVLDDHVESWYVTSSEPLPEPAVGIGDVHDLTLSEEWLAPPERSRPEVTTG
jgi:hypothetical protein